MNVLAVWPSNEPVNVGNALLIAVIAIFIVFLVLSIIIFVTWLLQKSMEKINAKTNILPKEENKILSEDENAVWLIDYWCNKDLKGLILMPFSRHWIMHIEAMRRIKDKLDKITVKE